MTLQNWLDHGWLQDLPAQDQDIRKLLKAMDRDLADCLNPTVSEQELLELIALAQSLREQLLDWLRKHGFELKSNL